MIVTVRTDLTWSGVGKQFAYQSEKNFCKGIKNLTGADDAEVIDWNIYAETDEELEDKNGN